MKSLIFSITVLTTSLVGVAANAAPMFDLTVTNTSAMPISGGVVYISSNQGGASEVGQAPTAGFITLCQTGNSTSKFNELSGDKNIKYAAQTPGPILPGKSITIAVPMPAAKTESLHFEAMYGKSKEACASISLPANAFNVAKENGSVIGRDEVVVAGAALAPEVPMMNSADYQHICEKAAGAVDCLRILADGQYGDMQIGYFPGYLPSVLNYLESLYGASDVKTLVIPSAGAVHYSLKMK
jgi:hypothetical protein